MITINTSMADRTLALVCSGAEVDETAVRASEVVQAQIQHNLRLRDTATMDAYVAALRAASACQAPADDPFRIGDVIANRAAYRTKIDALKVRQDEIAAVAAARIEPYLPAGMDYRGDVVLAVPYFSCGGFAARGRFFIDVRCLADDISADNEALTMLVTHETFHAIQEQVLFQPEVGPNTTTHGALESLFSALITEGTATYVGRADAVMPATGGGMLTQINRRFAGDNAQRMRANFSLLTMLFDHVRRARDPEPTVRDAYSIGFSGGTYQEMGYFVGAQMAGDIERAWGRDALVCVMRLPPEQFVLAHDAVAAASTADPALLRLGPAAEDAARYVARRRGGQHGYAACRG
ncbi:hypothetical protein U91I_03779 [alpha proteobacterium U9-1i]|nr:hypothetical protein U91I_03779 [alpha proteobacterium U9-1i]